LQPIAFLNFGKLITTAYLVGACLFATTAAAQPNTAPSPQIAAIAQAVLPHQEQDYLAIIDKARQQFAAGKSADARRNARLGLQIKVHEFMGLTHSAEDWIGIYKDNKRAENGDRSIEIEIAPGVILTTWDNSYVDANYRTMVRPRSSLARTLDGLSIGDAVRFSADLIGEVISTDDAMVLQPRIVASFSKLQKLSDTGAQ